jgi:U3 small nucleolar RNA-associated protein MPP10
VEGFDSEQIWQEVNMEHQPLLALIEQKLEAERSALEAMSDEDISDISEGDEVVNEEAAPEVDANIGEDGAGDVSEGEVEEGAVDIEDEEDDEGDGEEIDGFTQGVDTDLNEDDSTEKEKEPGDEEADFFDLDEMNKFADRAEDEDLEDDTDDEGDDELDEDDFGFEGDEDDDEEGEGEAGDEKKLKYQDFFDKPSSAKRKKPAGDESDQAETEVLSTFEKRQRAMQSKISEIESKIASPRDWEQIGEVDAYHRPIDSLLVLVKYSTIPFPTHTIIISLFLLGISSGV